MIRSIIAGIVATAIGVGVTSTAMAEQRGYRHHGYQHHGYNHQGYNHHWRGHQGHGHHYGWDRNRDGRVDWRDRRHYNHGHHYGWDRNRDGRVDWRDRRAPSNYWGDFFGRRY